MDGFVWATASPKERADMIRRAPAAKTAACDLFEITSEGYDAIMSGADWSSGFERPGDYYPKSGYLRITVVV